MRIRVATLNVWALPTPLAEQVSARMDAIAALLPALELDAISFQEVWTPSARDVLIAGGNRANLRHVWHNDASFGGSGLLVLSRLPIEQVRFERYALRGLPEKISQGDFYGGKGFAQVRLGTPAGAITLVNTHLQARYSKTVPHEYRTLRTGQIVQLALATREVRGPVIVVGDFNLRDHDESYRVLTGLTGLRDVAAELNHAAPTVVRRNAYRRGTSKPDHRIDYVFARDGADRRILSQRAKRVFDEPLILEGEPAAYSNHLGVLVELAIEAGPGRTPHAPDRYAIQQAAQLLSRGRSEAERRQRGTRAWAGAGMGCALIAAAGNRGLATTRRRLLRGTLRGAAIAALTPGIGFSILSEIFVPDELRAFEVLAKRLTRLDTSPDSEPHTLA